ncbi:sulfatase-like hydrolase/transferase [Pontiella sulfatireligans]|uniref:Arylsulfatase n=1 Tax=Pontiella sulfatireligans TaxID=2750658 RepID=A0A6C2UM97_9BACT|nr:sulfatase-like hydrolase/transferase [Pontiella sulfatireligans]SPS74406.1 sulfatase S1_19 [Kiritimatiellales bacterium]VGO20401.1 Arylsulfatase [Pontiella sulfatireligans]
MKQILKILTVILCSLTLQTDAAEKSSAVSSSKPNIVLLFSDDAGYGDFGFQGSHHFKTPHLDQLAKDGVRLSNFYVSGATCGPSRAGLLSGKYQQRFGYEEINVSRIMSENSKVPADEMGLPTDLRTMGNYLQELGYYTAIFGKWHQGAADRYHPLKRGFDEFYGMRGGSRSFFAYKNPDRVVAEALLERNFGHFQEHRGYLTDVLADETCDFIERSAQGNKPFFAFVSFNAVHTPMQPDPKDANEFPQLEGKRRKVAQMTLSMDRACGQIIDKLKALGLYENTLIVFSNDNGGPMNKNGSSNYPLSGVKATQLEGGIRVPGLISWPGKLPAGSVYDYPLITLDLIPTFVAVGDGDPAAIEGLDGVNMIPYLTGGNSARPHQTLHWKMETRAAIRDGDWKLLRYPDRPAELFNLSEDIGEQNDLAAENPEIVKELFRKQFAWELELARPLWMLRRQEEGWSSRRTDEFRHPPAKTY